MYFVKDEAKSYGAGRYSLYVAYSNELVFYEGVDKDRTHPCHPKNLTNEYKSHSLTA